MKTYEVTIVKQGTIRVEAEDRDDAEAFAREMEADGSFFMDLIVEATEADDVHP